jgi:hypothetical protein
MVSKLKRLSKEGEKTFAGYALNKGLITRIHRELKKINSPKINKSINNWAGAVAPKKQPGTGKPVKVAV